MLAKAFLALCGLILLSNHINAEPDKVICYHGTWSVYRLGNGRFIIEDIDPFICTHLIYTFVGINPIDGTVVLLDEPLDIEEEGFRRFNALKLVNPKLKTLLAIGGWNEGSENYSIVAANATLRANFIASARSMVQTHGFDGFDLDWEYPGQRGGRPEDRDNFSILCREFRTDFDRHGLLLTAAVAASASSVDISYDVPELNKYLHYIHVMTYDLRGSWDGFTGHHTGLYPSAADRISGQLQLNVDACIKAWIERGADPEKLILGVGSYARTFTLASVANVSLGAPTSGPGVGGPLTNEGGMLGYNEIVELQNEGGWNVVWDDDQKVPHAHKNNQWIGYDDPDAIRIKVDYAKEFNLGGIMLWSIETDDFLGLSGTKFPILTAVNEELGLTNKAAALPTTTSIFIIISAIVLLM